jgi:divalent metal cation (Fe/Co/Zn/Cd) transporter
MKVRPPRKLTPEHEKMVRRAVRLQRISVGILTSVVAVMALAMGSSQAMRTVWVEDILGLVPPIAFLVAARVQRKPPSGEYPYGRHRAISIAFLVAATTLCAFGLALLGGALITLARREHPTIGIVSIFGHPVWHGWAMIAALVYSTLPTVVLGRLKLPLARSLHAKVLHADAQMNKADWMTGLAGMLGIVGIGLGLWWADALAALLISWSVLADGVRALRMVVGDLMDRAPRPVDEQEQFDVERRLRDYLTGLDWVAQHDVRLREEGDVCVGEIFLVPKSEDDLPRRIERVRRESQQLDWRLYELVVTALPSLEEPGPD